MKVRDEAGALTIWQRIKAAMSAKDEATVNTLLAEAETSGARAVATNDADTHVHVHTSDEAPPGADPASVPIMDRAIDRRFADAEERLDKIATEVGAMSALIDDIAEKLDIAKEDIEEAAGVETEMQDEIGGEKEDEDEDDPKKKKEKSKDSAMLHNAYQFAVAGAEILAPGIRIAAFDAKAKPGKGLDDLCRLRKNALDLAYNQPETRGLIEEINGKPLSTKDMKCGQIRTLFNATVALTKQVNNQTTRVGDGTPNQRGGGGMGIKGPVQSLAELNKRNAERYGPKK